MTSSFFYDSKMKALLKEKPTKRKSFAKSTRLSDMSLGDLLKLDKETSTKGKITGSLWLHDKKTRQKLNDIGWAIRNKQ